MEYTKEQIQAAKAGATPATLAYIQELETRLQGINKIFQAFNRACDRAGLPPLEPVVNDDVVLQETPTTPPALTDGTRAKSKSGIGEIRLFLPTSEDEDDQSCGVSWYGLCGYFSVVFSTNTPDEARALYAALLTVTEVDAD